MAKNPPETPSYAEVARILQRAFGPDEGLVVLEFIVARTPPEDVARQQDVREVEAALRLEIERVRLEIERLRTELMEKIEENRLEIERVRADLTEKMGQIQADLTKKIEENRLEIERVRADLIKEIGQTKVSLIRWAFVFWVSQMAALVGILFALVQLLTER